MDTGCIFSFEAAVAEAMHWPTLVDVEKVIWQELIDGGIVSFLDVGVKEVNVISSDPKIVSDS